MAGGAFSAALLGAALIGTGTSVSFEEAGHVQIKADPGVEVSIDGRWTGVAEDEHGVMLKGVTPGMRALVAHRAGYTPQHAVIRIAAGEVTVHRLAPWQARSKTNVEDPGALIIQTLPVEATISAIALGYSKVEKTDAPLVLPRVPAGRHKLTFCNDYKCIDYRAVVGPGDIVNLLVDFDPGEVHDLSASLKARAKRMTRRCLEIEDVEACKQACALASQLDLPSAACGQVAEPAPVLPPAAIPASDRRSLPFP